VLVGFEGEQVTLSGGYARQLQRASLSNTSLQRGSFIEIMNISAIAVPLEKEVRQPVSVS
jgi:predicted kinase